MVRAMCDIRRLYMSLVDELLVQMVQATKGA